MILKNYACRCMVAICAFVLVACVDDTYRLDEVSTEVTLAGGTTTLPLGKLSPKTIGDLIGDMEVEGLECDSEGNYSFSYSGSGQTFLAQRIDLRCSIHRLISRWRVLLSTQRMM